MIELWLVAGMSDISVVASELARHCGSISEDHGPGH